jgi:hypothetical protein
LEKGTGFAGIARYPFKLSLCKPTEDLRAFGVSFATIFCLLESLDDVRGKKVLKAEAEDLIGGCMQASNRTHKQLYRNWFILIAW